MSARDNVAIVDADLTGRRNVAVLFEAVRLLDAARVASPIARARAEGVTLAELADRYDTAFTLTEGAVETFLSGFTGFETIIVDAPQPFAAPARPFVRRARRIFIVLEPTLLGITGAQSLLADLHRFGVPGDRIELVTNMRSEAGAVPRGDIESVLGARIIAEIPALTNRSLRQEHRIAAEAYRDAARRRGDRRAAALCRPRVRRRKERRIRSGAALARCQARRLQASRSRCPAAPARPPLGERRARRRRETGRAAFEGRCHQRHLRRRARLRRIGRRLSRDPTRDSG